MSHPYGNPPGPGSPGPPPGSPPPGWGPPPGGQPPGPPPGWGPPPMGPGGPPPNGRRRTGLIVAIVLVVVALIAGGVVTGVALTGGDDEASSAPEDSPSESPTNDAEEQSGEESDEDVESDDSADLATFEARLESSGFTCHESLTEPYELRSCYWDPAPDNFANGEIQTVQDDNGQVGYIGASVSHDGSVAPFFNGFYRAARGTLLDLADVTAVRTGPTERNFRLSWGTAYRAPLQAKAACTWVNVWKPGFDFDYPEPQFRVPQDEITRFLKRQGFACVKRGTECGKNFGGRFTYTLEIDRGAFSYVDARWGIDGRATRRHAQRAVDELFLPVAQLILGADVSSSTLRTWIEDNLDTKIHEADLGGLHLRLEGLPPGLTGITDRKVAIGLRIQAIDVPIDPQL